MAAVLSILFAALSIAVNGCQLPCKDGDTQCYITEGCGCVKFIASLGDFDTFLEENNYESCTTAPDQCPENCASYFDGCNNCKCINGKAACNKMFCAVKAEPACLTCTRGYDFDENRECLRKATVPCPEVRCMDPCKDYTDPSNPKARCGKNKRCVVKKGFIDGRPECPGCKEFVSCQPKFPKGMRCGNTRCKRGEECCNQSCGQCVKKVENIIYSHFKNCSNMIDCVVQNC